MAIRQYVDPRSLFCLTGMAVRLAQRLGLQRDGGQFGLTPFETELRRRLWWTLAGYDRRIGELTGSTITAISTGGDCKLPLNINDADLHLHAKESPTSYKGATEMMFALTRLEFSKAPGSDKMKGGSKETNPSSVSGFADSRSSSYMENLTAYMENTYLKYCDTKVPLHFFSVMMTRQNLSKLKVLSGFYRAAHAKNPIPAGERESLFVEAIKMLEYDSIMQTTEAIQPYIWYSHQHFPFPAYVFLVSELRSRTTGELCERAWDAMNENYERREMAKKPKSPMHTSFSSLFVKAWEAREAAEAQLGRSLAPLKIVTTMRQVVARLPPKPSQKLSTPNTGHSQFPSPAASSDSQPYYATSTLPEYPTGNIMMMGVDQNGMVMGGFSEGGDGGGGGAMQNGEFGDMDWNYLINQYSMPPPGAFIAQQWSQQT